MEDQTTLFVARHKATGLYATRILKVLRGCEDWRRAAQPTVQEVLAELESAAEPAPMWTSELNSAEVWDSYHINEFQQFAPDVEFVTVTLSFVPVTQA